MVVIIFTIIYIQWCVFLLLINMLNIPRQRDNISMETGLTYFTRGVSLVAQTVKNLTAMQETWFWSLGWEEPLKKEKATHSKYSGLENSMDCVVHGVAKSQTRLSDFHSASENRIGHPLQNSCLENPMGRGVWWGYSPRGSQRIGHDWATNTHTHTHSLLEANMKHTNHYYKNKPINPWNKNILMLRILWAAKRLKILVNGPASYWP